jgi:hypothetical protein
MEQERVQFGGRLRDKREERHLSLGDLAKLTKIPERSLERLESGRFDELPAEVFVRGFVRSYARAVGLDPEDMARRYGELAHTGAPSPAARAEAAVASTGVGNLRSIPRAATVNAEAPAPRAATAPLFAPPPPLAAGSVETSVAPAPKAEPNPEDSLSTLSRAILDAGRETRRLPLALAVIILVIVATITMSLLLRRPSGGGSPITQAEPSTSSRA